MVVAFDDVTAEQLRKSKVIEAVDPARPNYRQRIEVQKRLDSATLNPDDLLEVAIDSTQEWQFVSLLRMTEIAKNGVPAGPSRN